MTRLCLSRWAATGGAAEQSGELGARGSSGEERVTNSSGNVVSTVELDPWGGDTSRSSNEAFQPRRFTTYDRDGNNSDEATIVATIAGTCALINRILTAAATT